jgi:hypothetical protein
VPSSRKKLEGITGVQVAEFGKPLTGSNQFGVTAIVAHITTWNSCSQQLFCRLLPRMSTRSTYGRYGHAELPQEVVVAIQRILELNPEKQNDPLDVLSNEFNPLDMLNQLFPDGMSRIEV